MASITVEDYIDASIDEVWAILGDFSAIKITGPITDFKVVGEGVGAERTIQMGPAKVVERLEAYDPSEYTFTYTVINEDCPFPVKNYFSTVKLTSEGEQGCGVNWSSTFDPINKSDESIGEVFAGVYRKAILAARKALMK